MNEDLIRFVTEERHSPYGHRTGIFAFAYDLQRKENLAPADHAELCELLDWFKENLSIPGRFSASRRAHGQKTGISWIKAGARDRLKRLRRMAELVQAGGASVYELRTVRPGYILYEDDHQLIALPFSDTPR